MAGNHSHCSAESGLTNRSDIDQKTQSTLKKFTARDFEALQTYHVSTDPKPAEYKSLLNRYNVYLTGALKQFAQESNALKSYQNENNYLWVLQKEETCRMRFLAQEIRRKTVSKSGVDEFRILYEQYQVELHRLAIEAHGHGMDCWLLQDQTKEAVQDLGCRLR